MIEIKNLSKSFDKNLVLENLSIKIEDASVFGLVGINGAGKSTFLRLLSGVLKADAGEIKIDGKEVYENAEAKKQLFFLSDDPYYNKNLTGNMQAEFYSVFYDFDRSLYEEYLKKFSLDGSCPIRNFSKGMKRQMFISLAIACRPKYLLLDEAFDGLDPLARLEFRRAIINLQQNGTTVIISSHSLRELEDICDSFMLLDGHTAKAYGNLEDCISSLCKLQLVFGTEIKREDLPFECLHFEICGRVIRIVVRGKKEEIIEKIQPLNPLIIDEISINFEDMFIYEVENRGYIEK